MAYLDDIQPCFQFEEISQPSFSHRLLIDAVRASCPKAGPNRTGSGCAVGPGRTGVITERDHLLNSINSLLDNWKKAKNQSGTVDTLGCFLRWAWKENEETVGRPSPKELLNETPGALALPSSFLLSSSPPAEGDANARTPCGTRFETTLTLLQPIA